MVGAKKCSLWAIIFAVVWVLGLSIVKAFFPLFGGGEFGLSIYEIIACGVFFVVAFSPVYRSIWLDKKFGIGSGASGGDVTKPDTAQEETKKE